jgi:hypothetical protein
MASNLVHAFSTPGPRFLNGQAGVRVPVVLASMNATSLWRFDQRGINLGTSWSARLYNDAGWPQGAPLFAYESAALPETIRTPLTTNQNKLTFYFRKAFTLPGQATNALLRLRTVIDDGVVFHVNGAELFRLGMPVTAVSFGTTAARTVGDAIYEGPFVHAPTNLVPGTNVLAAEVHQVNTTSSDVVFGATVEALVLQDRLEEASRPRTRPAGDCRRVRPRRHAKPPEPGSPSPPAAPVLRCATSARGTAAARAPERTLPSPSGPRWPCVLETAAASPGEKPGRRRRQRQSPNREDWRSR